MPVKASAIRFLTRIKRRKGNSNGDGDEKESGDCGMVLHDSMSPNPVVLIVAERRINSRAGSAWIIPQSMAGDAKKE